MKYNLAILMMVGFLISTPIFGLNLKIHSSIGHYGSSHGQFKSPVGLAGIKHSVLVIDSKNKRIQQFTQRHVFEFSYSDIRDEDNELIRMTYPYGIAVDEISQTVFVTDKEESVIYCFDRLGRHQKTLGSFGVSGTQFNEPAFLCTDTFGDLYIADSGNNRVLKIDQNGQRILCITHAEGELMNPQDVYVNSLGQIYVLDQQGIKQFDGFGGYQKHLIKTKSATAFSVDEKHNIFIIFPSQGLVKAYSKNGELLAILDEVQHPQDVMIQNRKLYISDSEENKVFVYEY